MSRLLCLFLLLTGVAAAQSKGSRSVRILFLGAPENAPETLYLFDGTSAREVELPRMNLSPIYNLPSGPLVVRMLPAAPAKPEDISPLAPKLAIPEQITDLYLLVSSDPANTVAPVKMQLIDVDAAKFKKGQMLWFNLSPNAVGGQLGKQKLALASNSRAIVDAPASTSDDYQVNLSFRIPDSEHLYPLCETKWLHDPDSRTIFFVFSQEGNRTPRILGIPDVRPD